MKWTMTLENKGKFVKVALLTSLLLSSSSVALAKKCKCKKDHCDKPAVVAPVATYKGDVPMAPMFVPHWYAGAHIGESRTHDRASLGSGNSVTQIGPGWTADLGYQFVEFYRVILGAELGYTQYHNSNETTPGTNVASTEHFASYLAAVGQYPLFYKFNVLGKLGFAYSYAKKVFTASGASGSANDVSLYWGGGFSYSVTQNADLVLQWARARGNNQVGSTDLTSLGVTYHFV